MDCQITSKTIGYNLSGVGILNINKPLNKTSFEIVALIKKWSGCRQVGHAGTLDPLADGILPVCLGQATRIVSFLTDATKTYRAQIELGVVTDTYDAAGKTIERRDPSSVTRHQVEKALTSFLGVIDQTPPVYSALKYQGKPFYQLARRGVAIKPRTRKVKILHLELIEWLSPLVSIEVECGKGTYIRSLAHELGQALGCGAHLKSLTRLKYGPFIIEEAISLSQLETAFHQGWWRSLLYSVDSVLIHWQAAIVGTESEKAIRNGRCLCLKGGVSQIAVYNQEHCRAYTLDGHFFAILRFASETGIWHPEKVFSSNLATLY